MAEVRASNPLVEQFKKGGVAKDLRLMAAQGALPLGPIDLLDLLQSLLGDSEQEIREQAQQTMAGLPKDELLPIGKDRTTPPQILAWMLANREEPDLLEGVLQNTTTSDDAIEAHAATLRMELAELVVINQVRLLRRTSLLVALEGNANLNSDQKRRLRELRESFKIGAEYEEKPKPAEPKPVAAPPPEPVLQAAPEPIAEPEPLTEEELIARTLEPEEQKQPEKVSMAKAMVTMTTKDKLIKALKGDRQWRALLIRDPNRLVASAVLGSPNVTDAEIESFAGMKNVSDQILRTIGNHRDWTKKYNVIANLVKNPRTPLGISLGMVSRLNPRDLKAIAVDKNVPEGVRKQAKKFIKGDGDSKQPGRH
jgi:hypothetical protein